MSAQLGFDWLEQAMAERRQGTAGLMADTPRARRTDPETSHDAGDKVRRTGELGKQQRMVLEAVKRWPGRTSAELGKLIAEDRSEDVIVWRYRAGRRLSEVAVGGHIRRSKPRLCEATGNHAVTWYPK